MGYQFVEWRVKTELGWFGSSLMSCIDSKIMILSSVEEEQMFIHLTSEWEVHEAKPKLINTVYSLSLRRSNGSSRVSRNAYCICESYKIINILVYTSKLMLVMENYFPSKYQCWWLIGLPSRS